MFHLSSVMMLIQIPIVISIIIICIQATNVLQAREFETITLGWLFNLLYLTLIFIARRLALNSGSYLLISTFSDSAAMYCFLIGSMARLESPVYSRIRELKKIWPVAAFVAVGALKLIPLAWMPFTIPGINYLNIPSAALNFFSIYALALFLRKTAIAYPKMNYIYSSALFYAGIQFVAVLDFPDIKVKGETFLIIDTDAIGFAAGLLAKFFIYTGLSMLLIKSIREFAEREQVVYLKEEFGNRLNRIIGRTFHEITPPLLEIETSVSRLTRTEGRDHEITVSKKGRREIEKVESAVHRMRTIFTASLRMYHADASKYNSRDHLKNVPIPIEEEIEIYNVNTLIEIAIMNFKSSILGDELDNNYVTNKITFNRDYGGNCNITCNSVQMVQVFYNLFKNSFEATEKENRKCEILVRSKSLDAPEELGYTKNVCVEVEDNGPGIERSLFENIFRDGFTTKKTGHRGRGYGLDIVKTYCESNRGRVDVVSPLPNYSPENGWGNPGTRFTLIFPKVNS